MKGHWWDFDVSHEGRNVSTECSAMSVCSITGLHLSFQNLTEAMKVAIRFYATRI